MITPTSWPLKGHDIKAQYFTAGSLSEVLQEASCWAAIEKPTDVLNVQYQFNLSDPEEYYYSLIIFYDGNKE